MKTKPTPKYPRDWAQWELKEFDFCVGELRSDDIEVEIYTLDDRYVYSIWVPKALRSGTDDPSLAVFAFARHWVGRWIKQAKQQRDNEIGEDGWSFFERSFHE